MHTWSEVLHPQHIPIPLTTSGGAPPSCVLEATELPSLSPLPATFPKLPCEGPEGRNLALKNGPL